LFGEMGLFSLLKIKKDKKLKKSDDHLRFFKFLTGNDSDGEIADDLMREMSPALGATYNEEKLYIALSEAMTNAVQHAYPEDMDKKYPILQKQWWLAGSFNQSSRMMIILFYDQGVGIPATLPKQPFYKEIIANLQKGEFLTTNEGALILGAIEVGKTRSKKAHRGKGLRQCLDFSLHSKDGNMKIISGRGEYEQLSGEKATSNEYNTPLGGTFIEWRLKLS